jgi:uncharacterized protein YceH (UPF0502 family)
VLLLRGAQTPGELRGRTERLHRFDEIGEVLAGLQKLMEREPALAAVLPRQPGTKESRYTHLLSGNVESAVAAENALVRRESGLISGADAGLEQRVAQLEATVAELALGMAALRQKIDDLFGD